ncbi:MAG: glycosyltransferase family protein [Planctomycetota bacterium]
MTAEPTKRRILYGVHGYGRGHAARAQAILPHLMQRYDVLVLAGDDAYDQLSADYPVVRIPTLRYHHKPSGRRSNWRTLRYGASAFADMFFGGKGIRFVSEQMRQFRPHVVLSDSEGWTHHAARRLGIPRISFDHYGIMVHCRLPMSRVDRLIVWAESIVYRLLVCRPDRVIAVAFYEGEPKHDNVRLAGPLIRAEAREIQPTDGEHLLAYFSNARVNFTPQIADALSRLDCLVKVYGPDKTGREGNVAYCPVGNTPFLQDLASGRAILATAGNQLISEALHFGKPLLLLPEQSLEQRLSAQIIERWNAGMQARPHEVTAGLLRQFLARREEFAANLIIHRRDGLAEALSAIDEAAAELS